MSPYKNKIRHHQPRPPTTLLELLCLVSGKALGALHGQHQALAQLLLALKRRQVQLVVARVRLRQPRRVFRLQPHKKTGKLGRIKSRNKRRTRTMQNLRGPSLPCRAWNPSMGTREEPVQNCKKRAWRTASRSPRNSQNHWMTGESSFVRDAGRKGGGGGGGGGGG